MKFFLSLILVLASTLSYAYPFGEGSVVFATSLVGPGSGRVLQFNLCCGAPYLQGHLPNGFDYNGWFGGDFKLDYTNQRGGPCWHGCTFTGTFRTWDAPQPVDSFCVVQSGTLEGTVTQGSNTIPNVTAEYSQVMCQDVWSWSSNGTLTTHWRQ